MDGEIPSAKTSDSIVFSENNPKSKDVAKHPFNDIEEGLNEP